MRGGSFAGLSVVRSLNPRRACCEVAPPESSATSIGVPFAGSSVVRSLNPRRACSLSSTSIASVPLLDRTRWTFESKTRLLAQLFLNRECSFAGLDRLGRLGFKRPTRVRAHDESGAEVVWLDVFWDLSPRPAHRALRIGAAPRSMQGRGDFAVRALSAHLWGLGRQPQRGLGRQPQRGLGAAPPKQTVCYRAFQH